MRIPQRILSGALLLLLSATSIPPAPARASAGGHPSGTIEAELPQADSTARSREMADTVTVLTPVYVGAQRDSSRDRHAATSVRLDRGRVTRFLPVNTADALLSAPGVDLVRTGSWATRVSLRGLSGERVLVLVDGLRLETGRGHGAQSSLVPVDQLESVEIQPGASSAQFGSDALAGVVELTTQRPLLADSPSCRVMIAAKDGQPGGERSESARLRWSGPRVGLELSGGEGALRALVTPDGELRHSGYRDQDFGARVGARLGAVLLDAQHSAHHSFDIGLPAFTSSAGSGASFPLQARDADRLELSVPAAGARPWLRLLAAEQRFRTHYDELVVDSQFVRGRLVARRFTDARDRISTRSRTLQPSFGRGPVRLHGEWRRETTAGPRQTSVTTEDAAGNVTSRTEERSESVPPAWREAVSAGAFVTGTRAGFRLEAGGRWDRLQSHADSTADGFTPRLDVTDRRASGEIGLSRALGQWEPYARLASGFRAPNLEERYFNSSIHGGLRVFGNPDLRSERSRNLEAGLRIRDVLRGHLVSARLSAYRSDVDELITLRYIGQLYLVPRFQYANVHRARLEGIEAEGEARAGVLQAWLSAGFPRGVDRETGERLEDVGAARVVLDLRVSTPRIVPAGLFSVRARWTDASRSAQRTIARPAFWTFSAELGATLARARVTLAVRNLTDARYYEPLSFIPEAGRTFALAARWEGAFVRPSAPHEETR